MKDLIFLFLLFSFSILNAQSISIKGFVGGGETLRLSTFPIQSPTDSNLYIFRGLSTNEPGARIALSLNRKNGDFIEMSGIYTKNLGAIGSGFFSPTSNQSKAEVVTKFYELSIDYFFKFNKIGTEKINFYWSPSLSYVYNSGKITPNPNEEIYEAQKIRSGLVLKLLSRITYQMNSPAWKVEGGFGLNTFDYFYERNKENEAGSNRNIFKLNDRLNAFGRIGISYTFNAEKDS